MSIKRYAYHDATVFEKEMQSLFFRRVFAGTQYDFEEIDSYRSLKVGCKAVSIRRSALGVHGFDNVCLHRACLIDPPGQGIRKFRCGYHGWRYNENGKLASTPFADDTCINQRVLAKYPVTEIDGLYFLSITENIPDIGEVQSALRQTEVELERPFHKASLDHACNWKLLVENVLEGYHLSFVHADTFRPAGFTSAGHYTWDGGRETSWNIVEPGEVYSKKLSIRRLSPDAGHFYKHAHIFPDLFVSNTNGMVGFLSHLVPISTSLTRLEWMLFELPALKAMPTSLREQIKKDAINFTTAVLKEDQELVELCQSGLATPGAEYQLQPCEARVIHFHKQYHSWMNHV